ncbi:hypothetical protein J8273_8436 [Carpediemonas membranifera]|uniref:Uncharacterized protein n=1 Tax=Carpediemonas membranifera TaxID=201153 RepID=A0A8J6AZK6_9EUKA|nr:hypothetical protein J8273_8436 [Carpediemonas membranifera]|eukprot:KAG9389762.1 hypothetical protein J8273_8436 [Carpediemonas membranifera]
MQRLSGVTSLPGSVYTVCVLAKLDFVGWPKKHKLHGSRSATVADLEAAPWALKNRRESDQRCFYAVLSRLCASNVR